MSLEVLGLVLARGGSLRIPDKNLADVGGQTLVRRALETTVAAKRVSVVALSSDQDRILDEGARVEGVQLIKRPDALATPTATSLAAARHALAQVEERTGTSFDAVALVQCTSPFTRPDDIDGTITLLDSTGAGSAFSVMQLDHAHHPERLQLLQGHRLVPYQGGGGSEPRASHEVPTLWANNGSVYVSRKETIEAGSLASDDLCGYPMPEERSLDINTPRDLHFARFISGRSEDLGAE